MDKRNGLRRMSVLLLCSMLTQAVGCGAVTSDDNLKENDTPIAVTELQENSETGETDTTQTGETTTEAGQKDSKVYEENGYLAEKSELLNERMLEKSGKHFTFLYETYLKPQGIQPYFAIIPDKNYYLKQADGLEDDFDQMVDKLNQQCPFMQYKDIRHLLALEDYYRTDSHWKQDCLVDVAGYLCESMGNPVQAEYETRKLDHLLEGSYYDEIESEVEPDEVCYLTNEMLKACTVSKFEGMDWEDAYVYDMEKAQSENPYDMFLGGAVPVITITNPKVDNGRNLILFRDSFGCSIAPLFAAGYEKVTLVDIRYIQSGMVGDYVDFTDADVLFLYSTLLLNNSSGMK